MQKSNSIYLEKILKEHNLKITPIRLLILDILAANPVPLTAEQIYKKTKKVADQASTYRSLNIFISKGLIRKLEIFTDRSSFELINTKKHFHHLICQKCQKIEPINLCLKNINQSALRKSKNFRQVFDHSLVFMGSCKKCAR